MVVLGDVFGGVFGDHGRFVRNIAQQRTRILRARAVIAFLRRVFWPWHNCVNCAFAQALYRTMSQAHSTRALRSNREPRRVMLPWRSIWPD